MSETPDSQQPHAPELEDDQPYLYRLLSWRVMRRWLFAAVCLATLIGLFYAVEDWRGRRAWEKCRRDLEAKGAVLDWNAFIPPSVPDDQNIFKAPKMAEWFVRGPRSDWFRDDKAKAPKEMEPFTARQGSDPCAKDVLVAEVEVETPTVARGSEHRGEVLRFEDPAAGDQAAKLLAAATGPCAEGPTACVIVGRPLDQIKPAHLVMEAQAAPSVGALKALLTWSPETKARPAMLGDDCLQVVQAGSNVFRVWLRLRAYSASDYLAWTQPTEADFDVMRQGLRRPFARIDGDYQWPYERPVPNFVRLRTVAQMLAQRAQCYLLLGQPEAAWHELAPVRGICKMMEGKPAGNAPTLVEAMIDVAITGLYTSIIQDGLARHAWREPELVAMEQQLEEINLIPLLNRSFNAERAATCRTFEASTSAELKKLFAFGGKTIVLGSKQPGFLDRLKEPTYLLIAFAPRGWIYQNMCVGAPREQVLLEALDVPNNQVLSGKLDGIADQLGAASKGRTPFNFLAAVALPNFVKATQTMARNQTLANEAFIACGLERYRLAHGQYPETLDALVPQFAAKLPHDIIGGQPLKYHRTADGQFLLYSIGWNEKDDGGVPGKTVAEGDWIWQ
jgi:hypothetical protein